MFEVHNLQPRTVILSSLFRRSCDTSGTSCKNFSSLVKFGTLWKVWTMITGYKRLLNREKKVTCEGAVGPRAAVCNTASQIRGQRTED